VHDVESHAHAPETQCCPVTHALAHAPQLLMSFCSSTHCPLQLFSGEGQAQPASWQVVPPLHVYPAPQPPQLLALICGLVFSLTHCWSQSVGAAGRQLVTHA
jgi:hypothetical protein